MGGRNATLIRKKLQKKTVQGSGRRSSSLSDRLRAKYFILTALARAAKLRFLALAFVSPPPEHTSKLIWGSKTGSSVVCYRKI